MAKPDLDDGYLKMAHELLAAVMVAHTSQVARVVLFEVFSQIYGPAKRPTATLRPVEIARRTGLQASNISAAITSLLDRGMLLREGLSAYRFVKDYDSWEHAGEPVLGPKMASYAAHAPVLAMSHRFAQDAQTPEKCSTKTAKKRMRSHIKSEEPCACHAEADVDLILDPSPNRIGSNTIPPYRENGEVVVVGGATADEKPPDRIVSTPGGSPAIWALAPFDHDPAEVERIAAVCAGLAGPDEDTIPGNVRRNCRSYPLWYFPYAIRQALGTAPPGKLWAYAFGVMKRLWAQGLADEPREAPDEVRPAFVRAGLPAPQSVPRLSPREQKKQDQRAALVAHAAARKATHEDNHR